MPNEIGDNFKKKQQLIGEKLKRRLGNCPKFDSGNVHLLLKRFVRNDCGHKWVSRGLQ